MTGRIDIGGDYLEYDLGGPADARGLVVFAHGSGSNRSSPRNRFAAERMHAAGFATLLVDLLTPREQEVDHRTREFRFDIERLARRLVATLDSPAAASYGRATRVGLYGASTGAAAALIAAAELPGRVAAIVSRGGRPDLAGDRLPLVRAPSLLIVGELDPEVADLNRIARGRMAGVAETAVVAGASHLFEEPGTLEEAVGLACAWFGRWFGEEGGVQAASGRAVEG